MRRAFQLVGMWLATAAALAGCGFKGMYDVPLPGGAEVGKAPYRITARFSDVLDLVQQAHVKVNDVPVGKVERIAVAPDGWSADVTLLINRDVRVPENTTARLVQSTLLGEKFVELEPPGDEPVGALSDGDVIPLSATERYPEVEELLGALSMLLNGGGVAQLQTISRELNTALSGNEDRVHELLGNTNHLVRTLDGQRNNITAAIDAMNRLAKRVRQQQGGIDNTLRRLGPGVDVLVEQRRDLVEMLKSLDRLSGVAVDTVERSRNDMVADLKALAPTLQKLVEAGDRIPRNLEVLLTYPFTDSSLEVMRGDYVNMDVQFDLNLDSLLQNFSGGMQQSPRAPEQPGGLQPTLPLIQPDALQGQSDGLVSSLFSALGGGH